MRSPSAYIHPAVMTLTNKNILPLYFSSLSLCFFFLICMALCSMCRCGLQKRNRWMSVILWFYIYVLQFLLFINLIFAVVYQTSHPPFLQPDSLGEREKRSNLSLCSLRVFNTHLHTHTHTHTHRSLRLYCSFVADGLPALHHWFWWCSPSQSLSLECTRLHTCTPT